MATFRWSKAKLSKKLWTNIFWLPKIDKIMAKWSWKKWLTKKTSEYWSQLKEKQILRFMFWVSEKQLRKYYNKALRSTHVTSEELLRQLETRADNVIFRSWFAISRAQARQMISHWHFELNWQRITIPSIQVKPWDKLNLRKKSVWSSLFSQIKELDTWVKWIKWDIKKKTIWIESLPEALELEQSVRVPLIIEFYSRV